MVRRLALVVLVGAGVGAGVAVVLSAAKTRTQPRAGRPAVVVPASQLNAFLKQLAQQQQQQRVVVPRHPPTVPAAPGSTCYLASGSACGRPACGVFTQSAGAALYRTEPPATLLAARQLSCGGATKSSPPKMVPIRMP